MSRLEFQMLFSAYGNIQILYKKESNDSMHLVERDSDIDKYNSDTSRHNIYFRPNVVAQGKKGTAIKETDMAKCNWVWVDIDPDVDSYGYAEARKALLGASVDALKAYKHPPQIIIDSGNGIQAFWNLSSRVPHSTCHRMNEKLARRFGGDVKYSANSLMRLPYTTNWSNEAKIKRGYPKSSESTVLWVSEALTSDLTGGSTIDTGIDEPITRCDIPDSYAVPDKVNSRLSGDATGLKDTSGSGVLMSIVSLLRGENWTVEHIASLLDNRGVAYTDRAIRLAYSKTRSRSVEELVAAIRKLHDPSEASVNDLIGDSLSKAKTDELVEKLYEADIHIRPSFSRTPVMWDITEPHVAAKKICEVLSDQNVGIYIHNGSVVFVDAISSSLQVVSAPHMLVLLSENIAMQRMKDGININTPADNRLVQMLLDGQVLNKLGVIKTISGISTSPVVSGDRLISAPGYDEESKLFIACNTPGMSIGKTPEERMARAKKAYKTLAYGMLNGFEFARDIDRVAAVALIVSAVQRKTIDIAPGVLVVAPQPQCGKTTLVDITHIVVTGDRVMVRSLPGTETELDKILLAFLRTNPAMLLFDNIAAGKALNSHVLATAMTATAFGGRVLGKTKMIATSTQTLLAFTGNRVYATGDFSSRILTITLRSSKVNPAEREYKNRDIAGYTLKNRVRFLQAALDIASVGIDTCDADPKPESRWNQWENMISVPLEKITGFRVAVIFKENAESDINRVTGKNTWVNIHAYLKARENETFEPVTKVFSAKGLSEFVESQMVDDGDYNEWDAVESMATQTANSLSSIKGTEDGGYKLCYDATKKRKIGGKRVCPWWLETEQTEQVVPPDLAD